MRAATVERYGPPDCFVITEIPVPVPKPDQVLVRVEAVAATSGDARMRSGRFPKGFGLLARLAIGLRGPRRHILGGSLSGRIERVGPGVEGFVPGDEVATMTGTRLGAYAQFVAVPASSLVRKPAEVTHSDAAGILFGGTTALYFLRDRAQVQPGQTVLVNGASGAVGSAAVQIAKHLGAEVTAVTSTPNLDLVRGLGADHVVDYTQTPVRDLGTFDVVFDAVGNISRVDGLRLLAPEGSLILAVAGLVDTVRARGRVHAGSAPEQPQDFTYLLQLAATGQLDPITEVVGGLDALPAAHRRIDSGRKVGNLVVLPPA